MKYELINRDGEKKEFRTVEAMTDILNEFECTKIADEDILFLTAGMEIEKKDKFNRLVWRIKKIA